MENWGYRKKANVHNTATEEDYRILREGVLALHRSDALLEQQSLSGHISHHIMNRRFTPGECIYMLRQLVHRKEMEARRSASNDHPDVQNEADDQDTEGGEEEIPDDVWDAVINGESGSCEKDPYYEFIARDLINSL